ncbi:DUF4179 domain-containing protein [Peribacillus asahii]|uniref:Uncharacterized protein n=1 Tax=Peribacillus asahii TaxID=228899 RepID=A0A3Q9RPP4_9BACI|nr:DUF4179 domain-containing protein [Peribacillus asahii]AZV43875.1 hypothetical protein BAOM_3266 [Peribacillus asahii]USK83626.1 DUF4179 domain-containing protein [Peribacillus asahii]
MNDYKKLVDINIDEIEPVEVSEFEKKRVKQYVLGTKKKIKAYKYIAVAVTITIGATIATSFAVPSLASQIPIINNIMGYFIDENSYNSNFAEVATDISQVQSSNGVSVMIEDAVYDGSSITVSYAIETNKDLGTNPYMSASFDVKGAEGMGATGTIEKVRETTYVGTEKITPHFNGNKPDNIEISWEPEAFVNMETNESVTGDWHFAFEVQSLENKKEVVNQSVTDHGVSVVISSYETNDLSTVIQYEQFVDEHILDEWPEVTVEIKNVQDNLGNSYSVDGNGGTSRDNGLSFEWSSTIKSIDPNAKTLTIVPVIYFSLGSGKGLETKEMDPIRIDLK